MWNGFFNPEDKLSERRKEEQDCKSPASFGGEGGDLQKQTQEQLLMAKHDKPHCTQK